MDGVDRALSYTVLTDVLRQWLVIFCFAVSCSIACGSCDAVALSAILHFQATLYVTKKGLPNNVYDNESSAQVMAEHFEQILNSSILQKSRRRDTSCGFCRQCIGRGGGGNESDQSGGHCGLTGLCFKLMQSILKKLQPGIGLYDR